MRKNCLLFVAISAMALLFNACSNEEMWEDATPKVEEEAEGGEIRTKDHGDGIYDVLGFSYDITGNYLHPDNAKLPVVDMKAFVDSDPLNRVITSGSTIGHDDSYAGANAVDYLHEIKTKITGFASADIPIGDVLCLGANITVTDELKTSYSYSSKYSFARADVIKRKRRLYTNSQRIEDLKPYIHPAFVRDVNRLSADSLVANYGTHVLFDITIGGRLQFIYRSTITSTMDSTEKKKIVKAGLTFSQNNYGANASSEYEKEEIEKLSKSNSDWKTWVTYYGGEESGQNYTFTNIGELNSIGFNKGNWEKSVNENNAALVEINWEKAYPIYEFITDTNKKQQVKEAVQRYIDSKKIDMMNLAPVYSIYNKQVQDCFYTTIFNEYFNYAPAPYVQKNGVGFYIFYNQAPNTVPLYRVFDQRGHNHIYLSNGKAELDQYLTWTQLQRIDGYVYKYQAEGTIPIYAFYDSSNQNSIYVTEDQCHYYKGWCIENGIAFYAYPAY